MLGTYFEILLRSRGGGREAMKTARVVGCGVSLLGTMALTRPLPAPSVRLTLLSLARALPLDQAVTALFAAASSLFFCSSLLGMKSSIITGVAQ